MDNDSQWGAVCRAYMLEQGCSFTPDDWQLHPQFDVQQNNL